MFKLRNLKTFSTTANSKNRDSTRRQASLSGLDARAAPFEPAHTCNREAPSIGQDLWRQLKRVQIPVFHGDKRTYQSWKAAFLACIDNAPVKHCRR